VGSLEKSQGQALIEFLIVALALIPLLVLIPLIGKYQDIAHFTQIAARYASFDTLVRNSGMSSEKSDSDVEGEVRQRFFSQSNVLIKTAEVKMDAADNPNKAWTTIGQEKLISSFSDIRVKRSVMNEGTQPLPFIFSFGSGGIQNAQVSVKLANLPAGSEFYSPFQAIDLTISRKSSVLVNGWAGKSPEDVSSRFNQREWVVAKNLPNELLKTLNFLFNLPSGVELGGPPPRVGQVDFWLDRVPASQLRAP
jgi:hypothetical protein